MDQAKRATHRFPRTNPDANTPTSGEPSVTAPEYVDKREANHIERAPKFTVMNLDDSITLSMNLAMRRELSLILREFGEGELSTPTSQFRAALTSVSPFSRGGDPEASESASRFTMMRFGGCLTVSMNEPMANRLFLILQDWEDLEPHLVALKTALFAQKDSVAYRLGKRR